MKKKLITMVCLSLVIFTIFSMAACGSSKLTMENYNKITCGTLNTTSLEYEGGMTMAEVKDILGEPDSNTSTTYGGVSATNYVWGKTTKCITVTFIDDQAVVKVQIGL